MKESIRKIVSLSMALIVLFSTMSFSLDMHYCGDHLVDFSFSHQTDSCWMKVEVAESFPECDISEMEMDCCSDVEMVFEGQEDLKLKFDKLTPDQQLFVTTFVYTYINLFEGLDENTLPFDDYSPPPLIRDIQVLDQTFLI